MKVMVGSTFGIEVAAPSTKTSYVRDRPPQEKINSTSRFFFKEENGGVGGGNDSIPGSDHVSSDSSSSIGSPGNTDDEVDEEEDGVVSFGGTGGLSSLEDSLPIKRGLSNHYAGKSKSFANLSEINSIKELPKAENPLNKRRRVLIANKWSRKKSSFYSWNNPNSMPLLALNEDDEANANANANGETPSSSSSSSSSNSSNDKLSATRPKLQQSKLKATFKSQSCFSLTDLHVEHEHED